MGARKKEAGKESENYRYREERRKERGKEWKEKGTEKDERKRNMI